MRKLLVLLVMTTATLLPRQKADAATIIWVGDCGNVAGYVTIQAAIDAASAGDTINVCPGVYTEHVTINKAWLRLVSTGGAGVTRIVAPMTFPQQAVVTITLPHAAVVGFTLAPAGSAAKYDIGVLVAIQGNASAEIAHNVIRGGSTGVLLGCSSSGSTVYHNLVRGAAQAGINIDTCENEDRLLVDGSTFNSVHHNTVCGGLFPYSIAAGPASGFNAIHHNTARWISVRGNGNLVHNNTARVFDIWLGDPANATFNNTVNPAACP